MALRRTDTRRYETMDIEEENPLTKFNRIYELKRRLRNYGVKYLPMWNISTLIDSEGIGDRESVFSHLYTRYEKLMDIFSPNPENITREKLKRKYYEQLKILYRIRHGVERISGERELNNMDTEINKVLHGIDHRLVNEYNEMASEMPFVIQHDIELLVQYYSDFPGESGWGVGRGRGKRGGRSKKGGRSRSRGRKQ